jgi:hypothetical protein
MAYRTDTFTDYVQARFDRREDLADEMYDRLHDEEVARQRAEWEEEFGADNPRFPFKPRGVHAKVVRQMDSMRVRLDD